MKTKILAVDVSLGSGGAARVLINVLNNIDSDRFEITLILLKESKDALYEISKRIEVVNLKKKHARDAVRSLGIYIRKMKPHVVWCLVPHIASALYSAKKIFKLKFKFIIEVSGMEIKHKNFLYNLFYLKALKESDNIIVLTEKMKTIIQRYGNINVDEKIRIIGNPIESNSLLAFSKEQIHHDWFIRKKLPIIICIGRLSREKGYKYLLKAFSAVRKRIPCRLVIIGDGLLKNNLTLLAKRLKIIKDTEFLGFQRNPYKFLSKSDVFVSSSLREGLPLVFLEAMVCKVPIVCTDYTGSDEIISNNVNGLIAKRKDHIDLSEKIIDVLKNKEMSEKFVSNGFEKVKRFEAKIIAKEYEKLFVVEKKEYANN